MNPHYTYVGPDSLAHLAHSGSPRVRVNTQASIQQWVRDTKQVVDDDGCVFATFIVDTDGYLWIADRRSEHVSCARGHDVLSAGEILFRLNDDVTVEYTTNQSTGYCPQPESWSAVVTALRDAGFEPPSEFSKPFHFRRCNACDSINIIKDNSFECAICGADLPRVWNLTSH